MDFVIPVSYGSLAAIYTILLALIFVKVSGELVWYFRALCFSAILWAAAISYSSYSDELLISQSWLFETFRNLALAMLLFKMLPKKHAQGFGRLFRVSLYGILAALLLLEMFPDVRWWVQQYVASDPRMMGMLLVSIGLLIALEQLYVSVDPERLWAVKYFFLGLLALILFDFFLYVEAVLYQHLNDSLLVTRGVANIIVIPFFVIAGLRNPHWDSDVVLSRQVAFRAMALTLVGTYLLVVSIAGYYVRDFGGRWGEALFILLIFGAVILLVLFLVSGRIRAALSVFVAKHFFKLKYDYRDQWISITKAMNSENQPYNLQDRCLKVMADSVDSRGAVFWRRDEAGRFVGRGFWNMSRACYEHRELPDSLVEFMQTQGWVINLDEYRKNKDRYPDSCDVGWFAAEEELWLIIPLLGDDRLYGVVALASPRTKRDIGWEDHDFLKLLAQHIYTYLSLTDAHEALLEAKQFEAFHRISAFIVHDLKNVSAQLSIMLGNMEKHKRNPDFIDDCIETISHSVSKMDRILAQLCGGKSSRNQVKAIDVCESVKSLAANFETLCASLSVRCPMETLKVSLDEHRFLSSIENIIKNAIEAAGPNGEVHVVCGRDEYDGRIHISVEDTGPGMSQEFISNSLFHAFHTTKGNAGMGIGLFDAREFMKSINGVINVESDEGNGTRFTLVLPDECELHQV